MAFTKAAVSTPTEASQNGRRRAATPKTTKAPRPAKPAGRRSNKPLAAIGVLLVVGCATAGALAYDTAGDKVPVLALTQDVPAGHVITREDLRVADVNGSGFSAVPSSSAARVIGQTATANLPAGALLTKQMYDSAPVPSVGNVVVSASLRPGAVPAGTEPGRQVEILQVPGANGSADAGAETHVLVKSAMVVDVSTDGAAVGNTLLSVQIPSEEAAAFATAASGEAMAVSLLPVGS